MSYDNNMQIILSKVTSDNPKSPKLRVNLEINGQKYKAGLWPWAKGDGTPVVDKEGKQKYKGTLEVDDYVPKGTHTEAPAEIPFDDDIPF